MGVYLLFLSLITFGMDGLFAKKFYNNKNENDPIAAAVIQLFTVSILSTIVYLLFIRNKSDLSIILSSKALPVVLLDCGLISLCAISWHTLMKKAPLSVVVILLSLSGFVTQIVSRLLGVSTVGMMGLAGGVLIILSVIVISFDKKKWKFIELLPYVAMNIIPWSIAVILDDIIISDYGVSPMFWMIVSYLLPALFISIFMFRHLKNIGKIFQNSKNIIFVTITTLSSFFSYLLIYTSYTLGVNATQANFILSTQVVVSVLLGIIFLKEKRNLLKVLIAAILSSVGVYLLSI